MRRVFYAASVMLVVGAMGADSVRANLGRAGAVNDRVRANSGEDPAINGGPPTTVIIEDPTASGGAPGFRSYPEGGTGESCPSTPLRVTAVPLRVTWKSQDLRSLDLQKFAMTEGSDGGTAGGFRPTQDRKGTFESPQELADTIVVTANRFGATKANSVWPTTVVDVEQDGAAVSLQQELEGEAGVDIRSYNGTGSVATLSNWGVFNRHMLLLYNGRVVKDYSLGGFNLADFSPNELQRVELVKGPQSAFYGSDAVGGVVNLITPTSLVNRLNAKVTYGTFNLQSYYANAARKTGPLGVSAWGEFTTTENRRDNAGAERVLFGVRSDYLRGDHRLTLMARYFEDSLGVPGPTPDPSFVPVYGTEESSSVTARQEDRNYSVDLQYRFYDESIGEANVDVFWEKKNLDYYSLYNYQSFYNTIDSSVTPPDTNLNIDSVDVDNHTIYNKRSAGISGRFMREVGVLALAGGVDWLSGSLRASNFDESVGTNIVGPFAPYEYEFSGFSYWRAGQVQFDVWGNVRSQVTDAWRADLSGRLQFVRGRTTQPSYNAGLVFAPVEGVALKGGYAFAFRLPTLAEQFADDVYTSGNADLDAETARTMMGTVSVRPDWREVSVRFTVFRQEIEELIQYEYDPGIFRSVPKNVERFESTGLDFGVEVAPLRDVVMGVSGVWQTAEQSVDDGTEMQEAAYVPDLKWRGTVTWSGDIAKAGAHLTYTSTRAIYLFGGDRKEIEPVYEVGVSVGWRITGELRLEVAGYDLTDERRADQFGFTLTDGDYPGLGRRFLVELSASVL